MTVPSPARHRPLGLAVRNVTFDCADPARLATFWAAVTGYAVAFQSEDLARLVANRPGTAPVLLFFRVPEPRLTKNRVHIDLERPDDPQAALQTIVGLGATYVESRSGHGVSWAVLQDPEGNEFCMRI